MNKKIIAGAVLTIASSAAFAQSSVTIYGLLDAAVTATRGVTGDDGQKHSRVGLDSGGMSSSRIGFKGTEDLGGGTSAIFNLEAGFNVDNGQNTQGSGQLFGRRAIVGLTNESYGTIELGRQDSVLDDTLSAFDASNGANLTSAGNLVPYDDRINNSVTYTTANYAGFTAKANYAFGENAGSGSNGRFYGISLNYANDAFAAGLAAAHSDYSGTNKSTSDVYGWNTIDATTGFGSAPVKRDLYVLGASYDFGVVKPYAMVTYGKTNYDTISATGTDAGKLKDKSAIIGVSVPFGASTVIASAGYTNVKPDGSQSGNAQQYYVAYTYSLSKRTTLYAAYDYLRNSDKLKEYGLERTGLTGGTQALALGVIHKF